MDKNWFEKQFDTTDNNDKWGHQYRVTQQIRLQKSFNLIKEYIKRDFIVCDLCCGLGDFLNKLDGKLYGFDIANNAIQKARKLYPSIHFAQNELPNIPKVCDVYILLECINYLDEKEVMQNIFNNMNKNGLILISVSVEYEKQLLESLQKFTILKTDYTYFGVFSKIEPKLIFYSQNLEYIIDRKLARDKYFLYKMYSKFPTITKKSMKIVQKLSKKILQSRILVFFFSIFRKKQLIIILAQK